MLVLSHIALLVVHPMFVTHGVLGYVLTFGPRGARRNCNVADLALGSFSVSPYTTRNFSQSSVYRTPSPTPTPTSPTIRR